MFKVGEVVEKYIHKLNISITINYKEIKVLHFQEARRVGTDDLVGKTTTGVTIAASPDNPNDFKLIFTWSPIENTQFQVTMTLAESAGFNWDIPAKELVGIADRAAEYYIWRDPKFREEVLKSMYTRGVWIGEKNVQSKIACALGLEEARLDSSY